MMLTAQKILQDAAVRIQAEAQVRAPTRSGRLRNSITIRYTGPLKAVIGSRLPYAAYQEFGTGSRGEFGGSVYQIKPRNPNGILVFKVQGKKVFAKVVNHPGIKARPFMRPAFEATLGKDLVSRLADAGLAAIMKGPNA